VNKPRNGELRMTQGDTLSLIGQGHDAEAGPASFSFEVFVQSEDPETVGSGRFLHLPLMEPGEFTLQLLVRDNDGNVARDTMKLVVEPAPGEMAPAKPRGKAIFFPIVNSE
jgi:hypothetical protein